MIDKLLAELSKATVWMPTQVLKDKVGARSATNVGLRLKDLEKNGSAVSRSRMDLGKKVIEWRHADKKDVGNFAPAGRGNDSPNHIPAVRKKVDAPTTKDSSAVEMPTDKACCNTAAVVATTAVAEVAELRHEIERLKEANYGLAVESDERKNALQQAEQQRDENQRMFHAAATDLARINMAIELDPEDGGAEPIISAIDELKETVAQQRAIIDAKDVEISIDELAISGWFELAKEFESSTVPELRAFINSAVDKLDHLRSVNAENLAMKILNTEMPGFGAMHKVLSERAYLVRTPKKAPRVFSKRSNAEAAAMSSAKQHGTVNVFALVPVGKAKRGAQWEDAA